MMRIVQNLSSRKHILNSLEKNSEYIEVSDYLRTKIQCALLEMLRDMNEVCVQNDIQYFLAGGSCLGAVRHHGFIPWDDDVDLAMTRESYNRFKELFPLTMGEKYILNAPNYSKDSIARFPKVLKKDSVYDTGDTKNPNLQKLYIDIFILENIPDNRLVRTMKGLICNALEFISGQVFFIRNASKEELENNKKYDAVTYYIRCFVGLFFSFTSVSKYNDLIDRIVRYKNEKTRMCGLPTGRKHYFGEILPRAVFSEIMNIQFEDMELPVIKGYDIYLKNLYGDYMWIPPEKEREHHYVKRVEL